MEADVEPSAPKVSVPAPQKKSAPPFAALFDTLRPVILPALISIAGAAILFLNWPRIEKFLRQREESIRAKKSNASTLIPAGGSDESVAGFEALSEEEKAILSGRLELAAGRLPDAEENKILKSTAKFQTGFAEKIPTQAWTYEKFKQVLADEESRYKVPLPHGYKGKLEDLFKSKYLPAAEAFSAAGGSAFGGNTGDLVRARDQWVESLVFPAYSGDIARHRGVALTMLRPFISDTLSKIGTINSMLAEQKVREKERALFEHYTELASLIEKRSWPEAAAVILKIENKLDALENAAQTAENPPPYPAVVNQVDEGIRATLFDILALPPPAISDIGPIKQDIQAKKKVIESFVPESLNAQQAKYEEALEMIRARDWLAAEKKLREIELPPALVADAREKVRVLKKLEKPVLDSGSKSG